MTNKCIVWVKTWCSTGCTLKIDHLIAGVVCIFVFVQILMWATWSWCWWLWEIKKMVYLITLPRALANPTDQGRITGLPLPSPFTYRCVWQLAPPSAGHITWAPTGARVTSTKSHVDLHLPSAGDQLSELDHYGRWNCCSFTRDYQLELDCRL